MARVTPLSLSRNCFGDITDAKRILREIRLMRHFEHENVSGAALPVSRIHLHRFLLAGAGHR